MAVSGIQSVGHVSSKVLLLWDLIGSRSKFSGSLCTAGCWLPTSHGCSLRQLSVALLLQDTAWTEQRQRAAQGHGVGQQSEPGSGRLYWPHSVHRNVFWGYLSCSWMKQVTLGTSELLSKRHLPYGILSGSAPSLTIYQIWESCRNKTKSLLQNFPS